MYLSENFEKDCAREAERTLALAMLIEGLVADGFAFRFQTSSTQRGQGRCIGAAFQDPHVEVATGRPRIVINSAGDYTDDPATILNQKGEVVYRSICLSQDAYDLISSATHGMLMLRAPERAALQAALAPPTPRDLAPPHGSARERQHDALTHGSTDTQSDNAPGSAETTPDASTRRRRVLPRAGTIAAAVVLGASALTAIAAWCFRIPDEVNSAVMLGVSTACSAAVGRVLSSAPVAVASQPVGRGSVTTQPASTGVASNALPAPAPRAAVAAPTLGALDATGVLPLRNGDDAVVKVDSMPGNAHGLDVSQWSGGGKAGAEAVFAAVPHLDFAFARVAYGTRLDPEFSINWAIMGHRSLYRGGYLFLRLDEDPVEQVDGAVRALGEARARDLCLTIDFEEMSLNKPQAYPPVEQVQRTIIAALKHVSQTMKCTPVIYTDWAFGQRYLNSPAFARYPLWIADWTQGRQPRVPPPWTSFAFWQRSDHLKRSLDPADFDVFNGNATDLGQFSRVAGSRNLDTGHEGVLSSWRRGRRI
ncbi:GH25 family lysozyme M1 (1,4-beta-N-acetylmuramidase) [Paraburkholderia sp. Clong3]|uniref:GH25 family lysozyme n=1 Tax=Paraburkholderia sp. Clong3 TaxID=2991061 RepID=UPI003D24530C